MTLVGKILIPLLILLVGIGVGRKLLTSAPEPKKAEAEVVRSSVEAVTVTRATVEVQVPSQGVLEPLTETQVAAEVTGKVISVSPKFEVGEDFKVDEIILEIDQANYSAGFAQAEATLAEAKLNLAMEEARARQAERDWKKLGGKDEPTELVLRKPQLVSAKARIAAAESGLEKARRDLDRTIIRAPYACRIRSKQTDIGSFLSPGSPITELYRIDALEVRLPVSLEDFSFLSESSPMTVGLESTIAGKVFRWEASVIRTEGVVDRTSRSVFLVARIDPEKVPAESQRFIAPGLFVKAGIAGEQLKNVFRIPREAVYGTSQVLVINEENRVRFRDIGILRTERDFVVVSEGLEDGQRISVTALDTVIDNMKVDVKDVTNRNPDDDGGTPSPAADDVPSAT